MTSLQISIVIPTFRRPEFLSQIINTLEVQVPDDGTAEVVVVDNDAEGSGQGIVPDDPRFHYVSEPRSGVAFARNTGVERARGRFIVFLDDDEMPVDGWFDAFSASAQRGHAVCFGPVQAQFLEDPPPELSDILQEMFSREFDVPDQSDITSRRAYLGTGNTMFDRQVCFSGAPFSLNFNDGGEDIWLLRHLADDQNLTFHWVRAARVLEQVPARRCTLAFINARRYLGGKLRCVVDSATPGWRGWFYVGKWMAVGAGQALLFGPLGYALSLIGSQAAPKLISRCYAGLGKLMWWTHPQISGSRFS